jgi:hypothetical protein
LRRKSRAERAGNNSRKPGGFAANQKMLKPVLSGSGKK